jgi:integrase/recombinase XerD
MNYLYQYQRELFALGYAKSTSETKINTIRHFLDFTAKPISQTTVFDLQNYIEKLESKALKPSSIQAYLTHLKYYFIFLEKSKQIKKNPFNSFSLQLQRQENKPRNILTQEQIKTLYCKTINLREKILLHLCYGCGLRALELEKINLEDIDLKNQIVTVQKGKNAKRRLIPISQSIHEDFIKYTKVRSRIKTNENALLLNDRNNRLRKHTANQRLKVLLKRAGIHQEISLHCLRHSIATHLLENGLSLEKVRDFLGHKQLETTEIYTRISTKQLSSL